MESKDKVLPKTKTPKFETVEMITSESSLDSDIFVSQDISDYKCLICGYIPSPETAYEAICCGILFCEGCLDNMVLQNPKCPICKNKIRKEPECIRNVKKDNKLLYFSLNKFEIHCPYGCKWNGILEDLQKHLKECEKAIKECKYKFLGCDYFGNSIDREKHEKDEKLHLDLAMTLIKEHYKYQN